MSAAERVGATWFACSEPERPTDSYVMWHGVECGGCCVKAQHLANRYPDDPTIRRVLGPLVDHPYDFARTVRPR